MAENRLIPEPLEHSRATIAGALNPEGLQGDTSEKLNRHWYQHRLTRCTSFRLLLPNSPERSQIRLQIVLQFQIVFAPDLFRRSGQNHLEGW